MVASPPPWEWKEDALCSSIDPVAYGEASIPNIFYVEDWEEDKVVRAKEICAKCPAKGRCLDFALGTREKFGIWGGMTYNERRSLMRRMRKKGQTIPRYHLPAPRAIPDY